MKRAAFFGSMVVLTCLLSACPSTQTPVVDVTGTWTGTAGEIDQPASQLPLTVIFEQEGTVLTGTAAYGPVPYEISGEITGNVEGDTPTFSFSVALDEPDIGGEVTAITVTYTFTGVISGNMMGDNLTVTNDASDLRVPLAFELERQ